MNRIFIIALPVCALFSCGPFLDPRLKQPADINPPALTRLAVIDAMTIELEFDEPITVDSAAVTIAPALGVRTCTVQENKLVLEVDRQETGFPYSLQLPVEDLQHNSASLQAEFYGFNPEVPGLLFNEFTTNGSGTHPDLVEIKVMRAGNMGGVALFQGMAGDCDDRIVFPAFQVEAGDFLLVHFKPQNSTAEIDEMDDQAASGGLDASPDAFDFWVKGGTGLSGNNGVLSLYENPAGDIIDGVLYSNRTSTSDENYLGFGSAKNRDRALALAEAGAWLPAGATIAPEDGIDPSLSTGTRSLCRHSNASDTDTRTDWHIVPTRMSSFGVENCDEVYLP